MVEALFNMALQQSRLTVVEVLPAYNVPWFLNFALEYENSFGF